MGALSVLALNMQLGAGTVLLEVLHVVWKREVIWFGRTVCGKWGVVPLWDGGDAEGKIGSRFFLFGWLSVRPCLLKEGKY